MIQSEDLQNDSLFQMPQTNKISNIHSWACLWLYMFKESAKTNYKIRGDVIMRKIKFRVWNEDEMIYPGMYGAEWDSAMFNGYELMQYTEKNDKNGKEIYDGDILFILGRKLHGDNPYCVVEWINDFFIVYPDYDSWHPDSDEGIYVDCFVVKFIEKKVGSLFVCDNPQSLSDYIKLYEGNVEIVGNIYENPELLEVK